MALFINIYNYSMNGSGLMLKPSCNSTILKLALIVFVIGSMLSTAGFASVRQLSYQSSGIAAVVDASSGQLISIKNIATGEVYGVRSDECKIVTDGGTIDFSKVKMKLISKTKQSCKFMGYDSGIEITRTYSFGKDRNYFDRGLIIKNIQKTSAVIKNVVDCSLEFKKPFESASFHNDNMDGSPDGMYLTSINVFLRNKLGGLCAGLKYPYYKSEQAGDRISLSYEPNYRLKPGEVLELPTAFYGAYKKTGYTVRKEMHWKPRIIATQQEEMDLGEVRAMQQIMSDYLPEQLNPKPGYFTWLNTWWANENLRGRIGEKEAQGLHKLFDQVKQTKCIDQGLIASVWCGLAEFIGPCPEMEKVGDDAVFPRNDAVDSVIAYGKSIELPIYTFCEPNAPQRQLRKDKPEWKWQPTEDTASVSLDNCHANDKYEDWFYRVLCSAIDTYGLSGWAWDFSWVKRPAICYGKAHGHELGNCEFQQYRNVTQLIQNLRKRYPKLFMEIYWGLKEAGPWSLKGLNSLENAYENGMYSPPETTMADDLRFQHWYNHNYRFIPTYMNLAQINFNKEGNGNLYSLLSCMSASTHASVADWVPFETQAQADKIFDSMRKWKAWATENISYLRDRVDLFGQPCRKNGIDGTAHIIKDKGFIFVFNPWTDSHWGSIPLNELIGLEKGSSFSLDEISSGERKRLGVYEKGETFAFSIAPKSAMLIEIKPSNEKISHINVPTNAEIQPAFRK